MKGTPFKLAASLALGATVPAQAAEPVQCIEPQEMHGLIAYFLPNVIDEVSRNCSASLAADSYTRAQLPRLAARLNEQKAANWPAAKAAFFKIGAASDRDAGTKDIARLPDAALRPIVDKVMVQKISITVTPSVCADVNDVAEALAPLSAEQTVHLLATIFSVVARKDNTMRACPRETQ